MNNKNNQDYRLMGLTAFLVVAASMLFYFMLFRTKSIHTGITRIVSILSPIIFGFIIAYVLNPAAQLLENLVYKLIRKKQLNPNRRVKQTIRLLVVLTSLFMALLILYGLISMILPQLITSIRGIIVNFPNYVNNVNRFVDTQIFYGNEEMDVKTTAVITEYAAKIQEWFSSEIEPLLNALATGFTGYVWNFITFIKNLFLGIIVSLYILISREILLARFKRIVYAVFRTETGNRILLNLRFVDEKFGGFIIGKIIDSAIIGVICYIINLLLQMPYATLIAVVIGVTNIVPFFGPFIGAIPCVILVFFEDPIKALIFIIFILCLQQFDGNILGPRILGSSVGVSSFMVVLAILIGGGFFGFTGMIIGVPLSAILSAFVQTRILRRMKKKQLPGDLEAYHTLDLINPVSGEFIQEKKPEGERSLYERVTWRSEDARFYDEPLKEKSWEFTMEDLELRDSMINGRERENEKGE